MRIEPTPSALRQAEEAKPAAAAARAETGALGRVAREFEQILVRQLVSAAKLGGKKGEVGYGAMVGDALAGAITASGGLGLARCLEQALARVDGSRSTGSSEKK